MYNFLFSQTEARQLWVDALLSNKYPQISGRLASTEGYDPFGVACELFQIKELRKIKRLSDWGIMYDGNTFELPTQVQKWLGLKTPEGHYNSGCISLMADSGYRFSSIAKIILMEPPGLFEEVPVEPIKKWKDGNKTRYTNPNSGISNKR